MFRLRRLYSTIDTLKDLKFTSNQFAKQINQVITQLQAQPDFTNVEEKITKLKVELKDDLWSVDQKKAIKLQTQLASLTGKNNKLQEFKTSYENSMQLLDLALEESDINLLSEINDDFSRLDATVNEYFVNSLFSDEIDIKDCFIEIRAGSGGTESNDWTQILTRMYERWAVGQGMKATVIDFTKGENAGYKNSTIKVEGEYAFGWAKFESGVHRFVRCSPFDSNGKRHTSFVSVQVIPCSEEDDSEIELDPKDLKIEVMRAGGAGGQHVNTTESAVRITHLPTGISTFCQNERSQHRNKATALAVLKAKLLTKKLREQSVEKKEMHGQLSENAWGSQIRSYVLQPYQQIKDSRSGYSTMDVDGVLDGNLHEFMKQSLLHFKGIKNNKDV